MDYDYDEEPEVAEPQADSFPPERRLGLADSAFGFAPDPAFRDTYPWGDEERRRR